jgi:ferritin-like metal-binding protein YciE
MPGDEIREQLVKYLTDVHSTEENAIAQLRAGAELVEDDRVAGAMRQHIAETEEHERLIRARLDAYDASPSKLKKVAQKGLAALSGAMAAAGQDTTNKLVIQAYAFEHLEIASYRMLRTVAERAGDQETAQVAERILREEQQAAEKLESMFEQAALVGLPQDSTA